MQSRNALRTDTGSYTEMGGNVCQRTTHLTTELSTPVMHIGALLTVSAFHIFYALKVFGSHNLQLFEI